MKIQNVSHAQHLIRERSDLIAKQERAAGARFAVVIDGNHQDEAVVVAASGAVAAEYARRVVDIEQQLRDVGVELD